ncbi:MAG: CBS domain-containing protein [Candidatus Methanomethylophilaceae archaeon]|nr:CBS domain-containing protein [Candidatus Methanomethylophilaceae archaeon]
MGIVDLQDHKKLEILRSQIEGFKVSDVMDTEYPTLDPEDRVKDALAMMKKSGYQDIPVIENGNYVAMMSYGSLLKKKGINGDSKIRNLMSGAPTVADSDSLMDVSEKMVSNNSRQIAVVSGNSKKKVIGVVSRGAIVEVVSSLKTINEIKVWEVMTNPVEYVKDDDTLDKAIELMRSLDIRTVPVVMGDGKVKGVIGMKEVIDNNWTDGYRSLADMNDIKISVSSVCTNNAESVSWDSDIETAAEIMCKNGISTLPVLESGSAVGVITQYDILEIVAACRQREMLFVQLSGLSDSDKEYSDQIYEYIQSEISKISKVGTPSSLTFHYGKYNEGGDRQKYSVSGRLALDSEVFTAKEVGWDIAKVSNDLMKKLTAAVMERKDAKDTYRKRKK